MKKIFSTMVVIFSILVSGTAFAVNTGEYAKGVLIPITEHNYGLSDTVVGLICSENSEIFWTFFDKDSNPVVDGKSICSSDDFIAWSFNHNITPLNSLNYLCKMRSWYICFFQEKLFCGVRKLLCYTPSLTL